MSGCYSVNYIRLPLGVQKPKKPNATIRNWRTKCEVFRCGSESRELGVSKEVRDRYNENSIKQGWRTWCVVVCDTELQQMERFADKLHEQAKRTLGTHAPHLFVSRWDAESPMRFYLSVSARGQVTSAETLASDAIASVRAAVDKWEQALQPQARPRLKLRRA